MLALCAALYFVMLLHHPSPRAGMKQVAFFTECTCLFPSADRYAIEYRLDGWSCADKDWRPLDPRAYFTIHADDKESRFQRLIYFYERSNYVLRAVADFVLKHHRDRSDGFVGKIGGVRISRLERPFPPPGEPVERYEYDPLAPPRIDALRTEIYASPPDKIAQRCPR